MTRTTRKQRSYIASVLKQQYKTEFNLTNGKGLNDDKLYRWFYAKNSLTYIEGVAKSEIVEFIYLTLKNEKAIQPRKKALSKRIIYMNAILDEVNANFYLSMDWIWLKKKILKLYGAKCMKCGIRNTEMHVDHIIPRSERKDLQLSPSNLQVLCKSCNVEKSNLNSNDYRTQHDIELLNKFLLK